MDWDYWDGSSLYMIRDAHAHVGVLSQTPDFMPFIGSVPSLPGQFVIAGFNGHGQLPIIILVLPNYPDSLPDSHCTGMARIFDCAPGLVKLMDGEEWSDTNMPECFQCTNERLDRLSK